MSKRVSRFYWDFATQGPQVVPAYNSAGQSPWVKRITGSATIAMATGGMALALDATSEVQVAALYMNDILNFDIDDVLWMRFRMSLSVALGANARIAAGLGSAYNATPDSIAANAWFIAAGSSSILCESDDNVTDTDDKSTGETLATVVKEFEIDFTNGLGFHAPPTRGVGGKGNVLFNMSKGRDLSLQPMLRNQKFDMSQYTSGLQPYFAISKSSSTNLGTLLLRDVEIQFRDRP